MVVVSSLNLLKWKERDLHLYEKLTSHPFYPCLHNKSPFGIPETKIIALDVRENNQPVGLLLASYHPNLRVCTLHSIYVEETHRNLGLGSLLISELETQLHALNCVQATHLYLGEQTWTAGLEHFLQKHRWRTSQLLIVKCYFDAPGFNPPWLHKNYLMPPGCEIFPWNKLKAEEKEQLLHLEEQRAFPAYLSPFSNEAEIHERSSLGMRNEQGIVGWMINHKISSDTIRFSSLYVMREYQLKGHGIKLLVESIKRVQEAPPRFAVLDANLDQIDSKWLKFIKLRLIPYTIRKERLYQAWKSIEK